MISVETTPENLSLAVLALKESAAAGRIVATRMRATGDKLAPVYAAKAEKMQAAADQLEDVMLSL